MKKNDEGPAMGAAILAGVGAGIYDSVESACAAMIRTNEGISPDPAEAEEYEKFYTVYRALYQHLKQDFAELAAL